MPSPSPNDRSSGRPADRPADRPTVRIVTWNINSVRLRLPLLADLVRDLAPDVVCLQETKCPDEFFPHEGIAALGQSLVRDVRGEGLLLAVGLTRPVAAEVARAALEAGYIVNAVAPDAIRLAPPFILSSAQVDGLLADLPSVLEGVSA